MPTKNTFKKIQEDIEDLQQRVDRAKKRDPAFATYVRGVRANVLVNFDP